MIEIVRTLEIEFGGKRRMMKHVNDDAENESH
jgi:hypothetical protein